MRSFSKFYSKSYWWSIFIIAKTGLRTNYRYSFLGLIWSLLQPLAHITVMSIVFSFVMRIKMDNYFLYVMSGMLVWQHFAKTIGIASNSLISRGALVQQIPTSRTVFSIADFFVELYTFALSLFVMLFIVGFIVVGHLHKTVALLPLVIIPYLIFLGSISIALSYVSAYIRDIPPLVTIFCNTFQWTIPIVYPPTLIPKSKLIFFEINPLYMLIKPIQSVIYYGEVPSALMLLKASSVALIGVLISFSLWHKLRKEVVYFL